MKKILSMLLCALLVMSSMATVAFADGITLSTVMTFAEGDIAVAGTKVLFNVDAPAGAELTYYNNGVAVAAEVMSDGKVALPVFNGKNAFTVSDGTSTSDAVVLNGKGVGTVFNKVADQDLLSNKNAGRASLVTEAKGGASDAWQLTKQGRWGGWSLTEGQAFEYKTDIYFDGTLMNATPLGLHSAGWLHNNMQISTNGKIQLSQGSAGELYDGITIVPNTWYTIRMIVKDNTTGKHDMYINDILVLKDRIPATWSATATQVYFGDTLENSTIYRKNYEANIVTYSDVDFLAPAGDVYAEKVGVNIRGLIDGEKAVAYVNGVATEIATADGFVAVELPVGYSSVSIAFENAAGAEHYRSEEVVYYRLAPAGEETIGALANWEEDKYTDEDATKDWPAGSRKFVGINANWDDSDNAKGFAEVTENGNTYLTAVSWGSAITSGIEGVTSNGSRLGFISTAANMRGMVEVSTDYRFDDWYAIDKSTGDVLAHDEFGTPADLRGFVHPASSVHGFSAFSIMALWMTYYTSDTEYFRDSVSPIQYNIENGLLELRTDYVKTSTGTNATTVKTMELNMGEWHNYKVVVDTNNNKMHIYVDGALVASGSAYVDNSVSPAREVECIFWPQASGASAYSDGSARATYAVDNFRFTTYADGVEAKDDNAIVNAAITASGASLGIVPANLGLADDVAMDIAVIAKTAAGAVEIQKYEDVTNESAYKAFAFDTAGIEKVFVWNWATLEPIADVIE